ncbi:class E sortase [Aquihabitans sp. G128]|uniref:sortase n=1 Tax=Aquihabitans sp. G128 TaxID=2849779 RepID=UPI001C22E9A8|nr:class E sortase [Aquihabitans sp. G128]QXC60104.1 class E sortase [Aquihabitans sp. G128]
MLLVGAALVLLGAAFVLRRGAGGGGDRRWPFRAQTGYVPAHMAPRKGVVELLAQHAWARRTLGGVAAVLVLAAAGVAGYPFLTDQYTHTLQHKLEKQFVKGSTRTAYLAGQIPVGDSLTRIKAPKMGLDTVVVEGVTVSALKAGAGHYPESPLPCEKGNVAIAGHRTTYGKPFTDLEKLALGDHITLETPIGSCTYAVTTAPFEVDPKDVDVIAPTKDAELTLTTCHPEGSARQRLVVHAKLIANDQDHPA